MQCPKCQFDTSVVDSRPTGKSIRRRRCCDNCGFRFTTYEVLQSPQDIDALIEEVSPRAQDAR